MKALLTALLIAVVPVPALAECASVPNEEQSTAQIVFPENNNMKVVIFGDLPGPFIVLEQNAKTCKITKRKLNEDQINARYGNISDALEDGCVDNDSPECGGE